MRRVASLVLLAGLAACATNGPSTSYVAAVDSEADAKQLAGAAAEFAARKLPASSTVSLDPVPDGQSKNALTPAICEALKGRGFIVADRSHHFLRYLATPLGDGDLLRLSLDGTEVSRFFIRSDKGLQPGGPFTLRQADASQ
jgi:hypothetical protein